MLLKEWWAWWDALRALHAQEMLDQRRVLTVSDAGWQMDREAELNRWIKDAEGASGWRTRPETGTDPSQRDARREIRALFTWLRGKFWGDPTRTSGFEEDRRPRGG
ncbi:MAG TPA: hypothetical protein VGJ60_07655 [Chloroflexota bacterium]|jgi:hypothetical protein